MTRSDSSAQSWFRSANCDGRYGLTLAAAVTLILALTATGDAGRSALRYDRFGLAHYQWWRLLSAHVVHLGARHALLDCAGLVLIWVLFAREFPARRWFAILLASALAIDAGLWFLSPAVDWYLGASGVLHGALAAGAVAWYRRGDGMGAGLVVLLVAKLIYEQLHGTSVLGPGLPLVPEAHLYGALGGLAAVFRPPRHPRGVPKPL
ncbi:MAG TPA: rhombosortase [Steroidobacteraceae bacterium]|nr:rhombosortase [Steroidobacteraceae bacterium]